MHKFQVHDYNRPLDAIGSNVKFYTHSTTITFVISIVLDDSGILLRQVLTGIRPRGSLIFGRLHFSTCKPWSEYKVKIFLSWTVQLSSFTIDISQWLHRPSLGGSAMEVCQRVGRVRRTLILRSYQHSRHSEVVLTNHILIRGGFGWKFSITNTSYVALNNASLTETWRCSYPSVHIFMISGAVYLVYGSLRN